jgi:hypothetical protein
MSIITFPDQKAERERRLLIRAQTALEALAADITEMASLRGSLDGSAQFGPIVGADGLEAVVYIRPRRRRRQ